MLSIENSANEIIFFLGAGASIPAGVGGVKGMVTKFIEKLEREIGNLHVQLLKNLVDLLSNRKSNGRDSRYRIDARNNRKTRK